MSNFFFIDSYGNASISGNLSVDGYTINPSNSSIGQVLAYDGYTYIPTTISGGITGTFDNDQILYGNSANSTVQGSSNLTFDGYTLGINHIKSLGSSPTVARGSAAYSNAVVGISGTDTCGQVSFSDGAFTGGTSGTAMAVVTFSSAYSAAPIVLLTPANLSTANVYHNVWVTSTTTTWTLNSSDILNSTVWNYFVIG